MLTGLLNRGDHKEAVNYIEKLTGSLKTFEPSVKTGNAVTDVILSEYAEGFEKAGLDFRPSFRFPEGMSVNAFDVSVILNNALQNALENGKRFVRLSSLQKGNVYLLDIRNGIDRGLGSPVRQRRRATAMVCPIFEMLRFAIKEILILDRRKGRKDLNLF